MDFPTIFTPQLGFSHPRDVICVPCTFGHMVAFRLLSGLSVLLPTLLCVLPLLLRAYLGHLHLESRAVLKGEKEGGVVTPTERNVHGDALCFMVPKRNKTTQTALNNVWRLAAVGGWRLVAVGGGCRLAGGGPWGLSLGAVLNTKKKRRSLCRAHVGTR